MIERFNMEYKSQTPASVEFDLGLKRSNKKMCDWLSKQAVRGIVYTSGLTRSDIASALRAVAPWHRKATCKVIAYLKETKHPDIMS